MSDETQMYHAVDEYTTRMWHTSQHNRIPMGLAGRIQEDANNLRKEVGLAEFEYGDSVMDQQVDRCSVHIANCKGQHTHATM